MLDFWSSENESWHWYDSSVPDAVAYIDNLVSFNYMPFPLYCLCEHNIVLKKLGTEYFKIVVVISRINGPFGLPVFLHTVAVE